MSVGLTNIKNSVWLSLISIVLIPSVATAGSVASIEGPRLEVQLGEKNISALRNLDTALIQYMTNFTLPKWDVKIFKEGIAQLEDPKLTRGLGIPGKNWFHTIAIQSLETVSDHRKVTMIQFDREFLIDQIPHNVLARYGLKGFKRYSLTTVIHLSDPPESSAIHISQPPPGFIPPFRPTDRIQIRLPYSRIAEFSAREAGFWKSFFDGTPAIPIH